jgi:hypothetical protein
MSHEKHGVVETEQEKTAQKKVKDDAKKVGLDPDKKRKPFEDDGRNFGRDKDQD